MFAKILFVWCSVLAITTNALNTYDQSQTGDLNVQVDLKDVQIIALMKSGKEEYVDYDYAYDYSEMTIKPQNGTTRKPLNVTSVTADSITVGTAVIAESTTEYIKKTTVSHQHEELVVEHAIINETTTIKNTIELTTKTEEVAEATAASTQPANSTSSNCKKGFVLNQKGGCELKLQSASNALLKIIKLSQKLKRRENRKGIETDITNKK